MCPLWRVTAHTDVNRHRKLIIKIRRICGCKRTVRIMFLGPQDKGEEKRFEVVVDGCSYSE